MAHTSTILPFQQKGKKTYIIEKSLIYFSCALSSTIFFNVNLIFTFFNISSIKMKIIYNKLDIKVIFFSYV